MMPRLSLFLAILLAGINVQTVAQNASPVPPPSSAAKNSPANTTPNVVPTLKANVQLVVVDVVVTDKSQRPVHGLKATDFAISDGHTHQVIQHFEEHTALTLADATKFPPIPAMPPGVFTNYSPAPANGAVNVLLLDSLNTPMTDQAFVRQQLLTYLKSVPPGTRVAIFGLNNRLSMLQSFTSDPAVLKTVLTKGLGKASPILDDQIGGGGIQNSMADNREDDSVAAVAANPGGFDAQTIANLREFEAETDSSKLQIRAQLTLDAMNQIARYLSAIPGRKNLIWFSGSFPINVLPDTTGTLRDPFTVMENSEAEFRETVGLLARGQVAVYPIDARGLFFSPVFSAATTRNYAGARGFARLNQDMSKFSTDTNHEHGTMLDMAEATGGHAFFDTNDLSQAVAEAIDNGSNFYTISYAPSDYRPDGSLHKIKVEIDSSALTLAYRHGYYADSSVVVAGKTAQSPTPDSAIAKSTAPTSPELMRVAMSRGTPIPSEILFKILVFPTTPKGETEDAVAPGNLIAPKIKGPFRRYQADYAINPLDIAFIPTSDGKVHTDFELMAFVFDSDGAVINYHISQPVHVTASRDQFIQATTHGIQTYIQFSAPTKGQYFFRIGVHDLNRDRYGAVEISSSNVNNVTPPSPPQPVPAPSQPTSSAQHSAPAAK